MASPSSQSSPGTSSRSPPITSNPLVEVDISLLEDEAPHLGELLRLNSLKLIPDQVWRDHQNCAPPDIKNLLDVERKKWKEDEAKLKAELRKYQLENYQASQKNFESEKTVRNLQRALKEEREKYESSERKIKDLAKQLEEAEDREENLQVSLANQQGFFEDIQQQLVKESESVNEKCKELEEKLELTVKDMKAQLKQTRDQLEQERNINKELGKEKKDLENNLKEERAKKGNEIILLRDEKEKMTQNKCRFLAFLGELKVYCSFPEEIENEKISTGLLERMSTHLRNLLEEGKNAKADLEGNREIMRQLESLLTLNRFGKTSSTPSSLPSQVNPSQTQSTPSPAKGINTSPTPAVGPSTASPSRTTSSVPTQSKPTTTATIEPLPVSQSVPSKPSPLNSSTSPTRPSSIETSAPSHSVPATTTIALNSSVTLVPIQSTTPSKPSSLGVTIPPKPSPPVVIPTPKPSSLGVTTPTQVSVKTPTPVHPISANVTRVVPPPSASTIRTQPPAITKETPSTSPTTAPASMPASITLIKSPPRPRLVLVTAANKPPSETPTPPPPNSIIIGKSFLQRLTPSKTSLSTPLAPPSCHVAATQPLTPEEGPAPKRFRIIKYAPSTTPRLSLGAPSISLPVNRISKLPAAPTSTHSEGVTMVPAKTEEIESSSCEGPMIMNTYSIAPTSPTPSSSSTIQVDEDTNQKSNPEKNVCRIRKQYTPFVKTSKPHGVNRGLSKFGCLCGNVYQNNKGLSIHIRRMTLEWKYKCNTCKQYFFYKYEYRRHMVSSPQCQSNYIDSRSNPTSQQAEGTSTTKAPFDLEDIIGKSSEEQPHSSHGNLPRPFSAKQAAIQKRGELRKLQQEFLKNKKHAPWVAQKGRGTVQGSWYCQCFQKFTNKTNLLFHIHYWTTEWKFKCEECQGKFFCLSYLKKHLMNTHKVSEPLKEFSTGCYICGLMFRKRTEYYIHRKVVHNIHIPSPKTCVPKSVMLSQTSQTGSKTGTNAAPSSPDVIDVASDDDEVIISQTSDSSALGGPSSSSSQNLDEATQSESRQEHGPVEPDDQSSNNNDSPEEEGSQQVHLCKCGKKYLSKTALLCHLKVMKYGSIFVCIRCSAGFKQVGNLRSHMGTVHQEKYTGFKCGHCKIEDGAKFVNIKLFRAHCAREHDHELE